MNKNNMIPNGVWPTMLTPFTQSNNVDFNALEELIEWYIERGVNGLFAVCQSSEMFYLSLEERIKIAHFVKEKVSNRIPVIASGHVSDSLNNQIEELKMIADTGVEAVVLISNRIAGENESDDVWKKNAEIILEKVPEIIFGIYECPYPYKRLMSVNLLKWCVSTGRLKFLKDTCCDLGQLSDKVRAVKGSNLKIFNANAATLLDSMKMGCAGYSGVMANFHPELYVLLMNCWSANPEKAQKLQDYLGFASLAEYQLYPVNAKYYLNLEGLNIDLKTRSKDASSFKPSMKIEVVQFRRTNLNFTKLMKYLIV